MSEGIYGRARTTKARYEEADREVSTDYEEIPEVAIPIKGEVYREATDTWYLAITREEFDEIYKGLDVDASLFYGDPKNDEAMLNDFLPSKLWRLNNIYWIIDKDGMKFQFLMNYAQHVVYAASLNHPRIIILKSRQQRHIDILANIV